MIKTLEKGKKCTRGTIEAADAGSPKIHFYITGLAAKALFFRIIEEENRKGTRPCPPTTTADHSSNASRASIPHYPPTTPCARLLDALQPAV